MVPPASPPPAPATRGPRPNGWLLPFSFLLIALCAIPPLVLTSAPGALHLDAAALQDCLLDSVRAFCGDEFDDDATVLVVGADARGADAERSWERKAQGMRTRRERAAGLPSTHMRTK